MKPPTINKLVLCLALFTACSKGGDSTNPNINNPDVDLATPGGMTGGDGGMSGGDGGGGKPDMTVVVGLPCIPGSYRCGTGNAVEICNSSGTAWLYSATCTVSCTAGLCTGACTPGEKRCNGKNVETCNVTGSAYMLTESCTTFCEDARCAIPSLDVATNKMLDGDQLVSGDIIIRSGATLTSPAGDLTLRTRGAILVEMGASIVVNPTGKSSSGTGSGGVIGGGHPACHPSPAPLAATHPQPRWRPPRPPSLAGGHPREGDTCHRLDQQLRGLAVGLADHDEVAGGRAARDGRRRQQLEQRDQFKLHLSVVRARCNSLQLQQAGGVSAAERAGERDAHRRGIDHVAGTLRAVRERALHGLVQIANVREALLVEEDKDLGVGVVLKLLGRAVDMAGHPRGGIVSPRAGPSVFALVLDRPAPRLRHGLCLERLHLDDGDATSGARGLARNGGAHCSPLTLA